MEWHHQQFTMSDAMKMDTYSFGLLCLWFLFHGTEGFPDLTYIEQMKFSGDALLTLAQIMLFETQD